MRGRGRAFSIQIVDEDYLYSSISNIFNLSIPPNFQGKKKTQTKIGDFLHLNLWSLEWTMCLSNYVN